VETPEIRASIMELIAGGYDNLDCPDIVLKLLKSRKIGPNYNIEDDFILHHACYIGWTSVVTHLHADADLNIDTRYNDGEAPQYYAAEGGCIKTMELLILDLRFDLRDNNTIEGDAVFLVSVVAGDKEMASYLLSLPCFDPNNADKHGRTVSNYATWCCTELVSQFIRESES
jgi:hypothetical protein